MSRFPYQKFIFVVITLSVLFYYGNQSGSHFVNPTKERSTQKKCVEIAGAISSFYADNEKLPFDQPESDWQGDTKQPDLIAILTGTGNQESDKRNPRRINYLDGFKRAINGPTPGTWADGIDNSDESHPAIYDSWGQPFRVILDTNSDGKIANPLAADPVRDILGKRAIVYSFGRPNADGTKNTDESKFIKSW